MRSRLQIFKVFYERIFLCYVTADTLDRAINKAYLKYSVYRPEMDINKFTARKS